MGVACFSFAIMVLKVVMDGQVGFPKGWQASRVVVSWGGLDEMDGWELLGGLGGVHFGLVELGLCEDLVDPVRLLPDKDGTKVTKPLAQVRYYWCYNLQVGV